MIAMRSVNAAWMRALLLALMFVAQVRTPANAAPEAAALQARHAELSGQLARSAFGGPVVLQSQESPGRVRGDVYAVLDHPFATVASALAQSANWCDILILHLNTKYCTTTVDDDARTRIDLRVGKKHEQPVRLASLLRFVWLPPVEQADYMRIGMQARDGPYDTRDYELAAEAVPLDSRRTFLHMAYAFGYGGASSFALRLYLATVGRDKVGFTVVGGTQPGEPLEYVGGLRGVTERNTMRYYLAIDAFLAALALPPAQQAERRFAAWFDATERFPLQLHEVERDEYLHMKRSEYRRQVAQH